MFQLNVLEVDLPISLVLKNRAGWGNVVTLTPGEDGVVDPGTGGDRDGGDREEQPGGDGGEHPGGGNGRRQWGFSGCPRQRQQRQGCDRRRFP